MKTTKRMSLSIILRGLAVAMMATLALVLPAEPQSAAFDPQTLVGDWAGEFSGMKAGKGRYYLTIEKVDGDRVHLRIERPDLKEPAPEERPLRRDSQWKRSQLHGAARAPDAAHDRWRPDVRQHARPRRPQDRAEKDEVVPL